MILSGHANAWFLPQYYIPKPVVNFGPTMTQDEFNEMINELDDLYQPIAKELGARSLKINKRWTDDTINASAANFFGNWSVNMYGGLARHPRMTNDGFAMVICHELGHLVGGFPFTNRSFFLTNMANEGQSDYYALHHCALKIWSDETDINATFRGNIDPIAAEACNETYEDIDMQNLCYRRMAAGLSLAETLSELSEDPELPTFSTPDENVVSRTDSSHPAAQCRLDTSFSGALCTVEFSDDLIPGVGKKGRDADREISKYSCMRRDGFVVDTGARPLCWFAPTDKPGNDQNENNQNENNQNENNQDENNQDENNNSGLPDIPLPNFPIPEL